MLQERIRAHQRLTDLQQIRSKMPAYPIYRQAPDLYSIYVDRELQIFASDAAARLGQFVARLRWLRASGCESQTPAVSRRNRMLFCITAPLHHKRESLVQRQRAPGGQNGGKGEPARLALSMAYCELLSIITQV